VASLSGTYERLAVLSAEAALAIYLACCLAAMVLKRRDVRSEGEPFRVPGGPAVPLLACLAVLWILSGAMRAELAGLVGMLANAGVIFAESWTVRRARARQAAS
jgi:basic amino acid/polyamine antiporter, APA family